MFWNMWHWACADNAAVDLSRCQNPVNIRRNSPRHDYAVFRSEGPKLPLTRKVMVVQVRLPIAGISNDHASDTSR